MILTENLVPFKRLDGGRGGGGVKDEKINIIGLTEKPSLVGELFNLF